MRARFAQQRDQRYSTRPWPMARSRRRCRLRHGARPAPARIASAAMRHGRPPPLDVVRVGPVGLGRHVLADARAVSATDSRSADSTCRPLPPTSARRPRRPRRCTARPAANCTPAPSTSRARRPLPTALPTPAPIRRCRRTSPTALPDAGAHRPGRARRVRDARDGRRLVLRPRDRRVGRRRRRARLGPDVARRLTHGDDASYDD